MLAVAEPFLQQQMHPTVIISAFRQALEDLVEILRDKIRYKYGTVSPCMFVFSISFLFLFFKFHFVNSNIMNTFSIYKKPYRDVMLSATFTNLKSKTCNHFIDEDFSYMAELLFKFTQCPSGYYQP